MFDLLRFHCIKNPTVDSRLENACYLLFADIHIDLFPQNIFRCVGKGVLLDSAIYGV